MRKHIFAEPKRAFFLWRGIAAADVRGVGRNKHAVFAAAQPHCGSRAFRHHRGVGEILRLAVGVLGVAKVEFKRKVFVELQRRGERFPKLAAESVKRPDRALCDELAHFVLRHFTVTYCLVYGEFSVLGLVGAESFECWSPYSQRRPR